MPSSDSTQKPAFSDARSTIVSALATRPAIFASSARFAVATYLPPRKPPPFASGVGVAHFKQNNYSLKQEIQGKGRPPETYEALILTDRILIGPPGSDPKTWKKSKFDPDQFPLSVPDIELLATQGAWPRRLDDTETRLRLFNALVEEVQPLGDEEIRGSPTRHFKLGLNRDKAASRLPADIAAQAGRGNQTVEIWIDAEGHLRKLTANALEFSQSLP